MMSARQRKPLTGRHVLYWLLGFFGLMIVANAAFVFFAVTSFRGEDVPRSYRQGLEYNQTIEKRRTQSELGWQASYNTVKNSDGQTQLFVALKDGNGLALSDLMISATLRHPSDTALDQQVKFTEIRRGQYSADDMIPQGHWQFLATVRQGQDEFNFEQDLWVQ